MSSPIDLSSLANSNDPNVIQGLKNGTIRLQEIPLLNTCAAGQHGHTSVSFKNSILDFQNMSNQYDAGGQVDYKIFQAAINSKKPYVRLHSGNPIAENENERDAGYAIMVFNPNDSVDVLAAGSHDGYQAALANDIGMSRSDWRKRMGATEGWYRSTLTPMPEGRPIKGAVPNKYRMVIFHKKGFKIDNGGPPMLGTNEASAAYRRELRKRRRDAGDA